MPTRSHLFAVNRMCEQKRTCANISPHINCCLAWSRRNSSSKLQKRKWKTTEYKVVSSASNRLVKLNIASLLGSEDRIWTPHKSIRTAIRNRINRKKSFPGSWDSPLGSEACLQIIPAFFTMICRPTCLSLISRCQFNF